MKRIRVFAVSLLFALNGVAVVRAHGPGEQETDVAAVMSSRSSAVEVIFEAAPETPSGQPLTRVQAGVVFTNEMVLTALPPPRFAKARVTVVQYRYDLNQPQESARIPAKKSKLILMPPNKYGVVEVVYAIIPARKLEAPQLRWARDFTELFFVTPKGIAAIPPDEPDDYIGALAVNERGEFWGVATWSWWDHSGQPRYLIATVEDFLRLYLLLDEEMQERKGQPLPSPSLKRTKTALI